MLDLLALRVQISGYLPGLACDGKTGVEKANQDEDLILMDMTMPAMDGWEAARALRPTRNERHTHLSNDRAGSF